MIFSFKNLSRDTLLSSDSTSLSGSKSDNLLFSSLGNSLFLFSDNQLNVRWRGFVLVDSTVGSVSSSSLLWSVVDLNVGNV